MQCGFIVRIMRWRKKIATLQIITQLPTLLTLARVQSKPNKLFWCGNTVSLEFTQQTYCQVLQEDKENYAHKIVHALDVPHPGVSLGSEHKHTFKAAYIPPARTTRETRPATMRKDGSLLIPMNKKLHEHAFTCK